MLLQGIGYATSPALVGVGTALIALLLACQPAFFAGEHPHMKRAAAVGKVRISLSGMIQAAVISEMLDRKGSPHQR